jgi:hypothetical protein
MLTELTKREPLSLHETPCLWTVSPSRVRPPTGEPDAGDPHVRFGGRGYRNQSTLPTPMCARKRVLFKEVQVLFR